MTVVMTGISPHASAHRLNLWGQVEQDGTVNGRAYLSGGGEAKNTEVQVFGPAGQRLGQATTDSLGRFVFQAAYRCDHEFVVDTGDGHRATFRIEAAQFPDNLPLTPTASAAEHRNDQAAGSTGGATVQLSEAEMTELVERIVQKHVSPLRQQVQSCHDEVRLHDVLGGIGYIIGVTGLSFYFLAYRQRQGKSDGADKDRVK